MLSLRIEEEGGARTVPLPEEPLVVGRGDQVDVRVEEKRASRSHLEVRAVSGGALVRDLDSTNGTWLEDRRVFRARLKAGDRFRIGDTWFELVSDRPATPARAERQGSRVATLATVLAPVLVLAILGEIGLASIASFRRQKLTRARDRMERAELSVAESQPDPARTLAALDDFLRRHPDSPRAAEVRGRIADLGPRVAHAREARQELTDLTERAGSLPFDELDFRYRRIMETYSDVPEVVGIIYRTLTGLHERRREETSGRVGALCARARELADAGDFARALSVMTSFTAADPAAAAGFRDEIRAAESDVLRRAERAYRDVLEQADALSLDDRRGDAAALLRGEAQRFAGLRFGAYLRIRADAMAEREVARADGSPRAADLAALRRSFTLLAQEAEELAAAGLFARAADRYAAVSESVTIEEIRAEFAAREAELRSLENLLAGLRERITRKGRKFGRVAFGGSEFLVTGLTGDDLGLEYAGRPVSRPLSSLSPREIVALVRAAGFTPEERLAAALYCFETNLEDEFREEILAALEVDSLRERAGVLYARKEGLPYPEGGFVAYRGRILSRREHAEEVHRERIAELRSRQSELYGKLVELPGLKKLVKIQELRAALDQAREFALVLIFDEVKYFYPYRDRMGEYVPVQEEVDRRVAAVREVWDNPLRVTVTEDRASRGILERIEATNAELASLGIRSEEFEAKVGKLTMYLGRTLSVRDYFVDGEELDLVEYNRKVMELNRTAASVATDAERKQVEITNDYRIMMGRRALVLDDRLVKSSRGHCEEMSREGYFSHFSPHPERRTPDLRAGIEGYRGSAVSENIHRGSGDPQGAHYGWLHSSGHHRNILQKFWTEMGTGQTGRYWTQNFGRTRPREFPRESK